MPGIFFIAVMLVVGLLLFWGTNHLFRNQLPTARETHWPPDKSKAKRLLIVGALGSCAGWIAVGIIYWARNK